MTARGVFVFAEDGVEFFPTVGEAAGSVEAIDVQNGVQQAFFTIDGEHVHGLGTDPADCTLYAADPVGLFHIGREGAPTAGRTPWPFTVTGPGPSS